MSGRFPTLEPHKPSRSRHNQNQQTLPRRAELGGGYLPVMRLGLATRGNTYLSAADVASAVDRGVNYLNWCGHDDGIALALRRRQIERQRVVMAMQLESRDASSAARELDDSFRMLGTGRIDVVTLITLNTSRTAVSVVLMAPENRRELEEDLSLLSDWRLPTPTELEAMVAHGLRVRRHAGYFP